MRARAKHNLLVATVNAALEPGLITLECEPVASTEFEFTLGPYSVGRQYVLAMRLLVLSGQTR